MAKKAKSRRPGLLRTLLAVLVVLALAATLLFTVFRRQVDTMEYPCRYNEYVEYYAGKYNIDPLILYSFIRTESNFNPNAQSNVGARGLMQITEETFDWIKLKIAPSEDLTFDDLYDPETNIRFGTYFVSYCLRATMMTWPPPLRPTTADGGPWITCCPRQNIPPTAKRWTITPTRRCGYMYVR